MSTQNTTAGKSERVWSQMKDWCRAHPGQKGAIAGLSGVYTITFHTTPQTPAIEGTYFDPCGFCGDPVDTSAFACPGCGWKVGSGLNE